LIEEIHRRRTRRRRSLAAMLCKARSLGNKNRIVSAFWPLAQLPSNRLRAPLAPRFISTVVLAMAGVITLTTSASAEERWTRALKIPEVLVDDTYTTAIIADVDNPASCAVPSFLRIAKTESNYESITATILSAQAQGRTVRFFAAVCYADGSVHITGVWIQQQ
jgi:hypothetical protein